MYKEHARDLIQPWAQDAPENFRDVCRFVLLTIRMPLYRAVSDFKTLTGGEQTVDGREFQDTVTGALFGYKADAWAVMGLDFDTWWVDLWSIYHEPGATLEDVEAEMLAYLVRNVPGLGFVKAGFVLQIVWGLSGCIDSHNLTRFGIHPRKFDAPPPTQKFGTILRKCRAYNAMVRQIGGTAGLWNSWCAYVAENQPNTYASADTVSRLHAEAFNLI